MTATLPTCFGKSWEAKHPECAGGLDPVYTHPENGSHKRDRCRWFSQCATRTTASKVGSAQQEQEQAANWLNTTGGNFVPSNQLVRRPPSPTAPNPLRAAQSFFTGAVRGVTQASQPRPAATGSIQVRPQQQAPTPHVQPFYGQPSAAMVHPAMASNPWAVPMNYQQPGAQIPGYLTVPEPVVHGQHWSQRLGRSLLRAGLKAMGHTVANFFDHQPMNPWHPPDPAPPAVQHPAQPSEGGYPRS